MKQDNSSSFFFNPLNEPLLSVQVIGCVPNPGTEIAALKALSHQTPKASS